VGSCRAIGLDGANLLGFLAAVGTFATLDRTWRDRDVRMAWVFDTAWRPVWHVSGNCSEQDVVEALHRGLGGRDGTPEFTRFDDLTVSPSLFAEFAAQAAGSASLSDRRWADFAAAFGCEATLDKNKKDQIQDTALRTMSGAGHQHFIGFMRELSQTTSLEHLRSALFVTWRYDDTRPSMRWDPIDDRRYALRADDPSSAEIRTVRGANRLAIEAIPCFPTAPHGRELQTTGFTGRGRNRLITWPIWEPCITLPTLRSVLAHAELIVERPRRALLQAMGVVESYRCARLTIGQFRNFTPARAV